MDTQQPAPEARTTVGRAVLAHLSSHDVVKVVYGAIVGLAVVVGLESHAGTPTQTAATVIATALAMAVAEAYSEFVGIEARERRHVAGREIPALTGNAGAVAIGAGFPAVFFVLAALHAIGSRPRSPWPSGAGSACSSPTAGRRRGSPARRSRGRRCTRPPSAPSASR